MEEELPIGEPPCEILAKKVNPQFQNIKPWVDAIKLKEQNGTLTEWSVTFDKVGTGLSFNDADFQYPNSGLLQGDSGSSPFLIDLSGTTIGQNHCHTGQHTGLFSFSDVYLLLKAYEKAKSNLKKDVSLMLVEIDALGNPQIYSIMVSDLKKLRSKINSYLTNPKFLGQGLNQKAIEEKTAKNVDLVLATAWKGQNNEKSFLTFFNDAGITLQKAADINNLDNWTKINYIPGAPLVTLTPCGFQKIKNPKSSK